MKLTCPYCNQESYYSLSSLEALWHSDTSITCPKCSSQVFVSSVKRGEYSLIPGITTEYPDADSIWDLFQERARPTCTCDQPLLGPDLLDMDGMICENCYKDITPQHAVYKKYQEYQV